MLATRSFTAWRAVAQNPIAKAVVAKNLAALPTGVRTISASPARNQHDSDILVKQRAVRPVSPDLKIYQPQLTWYMSGAVRITGSTLAGGLYAGVFAYLLGPLVGIQLDSASLVSAVAALPVAAKVGAKATLAFPFVYHSLGGIRHLVWDSGYALTLKGVYASGYAVLAGTVLGSLYLAAI
ncbi:succinate dehydrogenase cytochrome b560 subunit [Jimgerdemannia flammicorona]|uniref:Succinate dehydrogenase cytochrome b560 subunit n=2 Tax=Jimgerdemannia flammicorona TaxID=994334 RepID=A0A433DDA7_9FUNG|nr:succinate dehydrogenase cytochrome b560 subunit [Jimgerdemannia flammicorona]RUS32577.1 succinate dehydrogenase cytochrome b560 subunit [Jimgerdemannia flammicorona]